MNSSKNNSFAGEDILVDHPSGGTRDASPPTPYPGRSDMQPGVASCAGRTDQGRLADPRIRRTGG